MSVLAIVVTKLVVNCSWRGHVIANQVRKRLSLKLGLSDSTTAVPFIEWVETFVIEAKEQRPDISLERVNEMERFGSVLADAIRTEAAGALKPAPLWICKVKNPCNCWCLKGFELSLSEVKNKHDVILKMFFQLFGAEERRVGSSSNLQLVERAEGSAAAASI